MARPKIPKADRKVKINVSIDPDIFKYINKLDNRSQFLNAAARILMDARSKVEK